MLVTPRRATCIGMPDHTSSIMSTIQCCCPHKWQVCGTAAKPNSIRNESSGTPSYCYMAKTTQKRQRTGTAAKMPKMSIRVHLIQSPWAHQMPGALLVTIKDLPHTEVYISCHTMRHQVLQYQL